MKTLSNFIDWLARLIDRIQPGPVSIESSDEYWLNAARNEERERQSRRRDAAVRTLEQQGYAWFGGDYWDAPERGDGA